MLPILHQQVKAEECVNSNCKEKGSTKLPYTVYQLSVGTVALAAEDATDGTTTQNCPGKLVHKRSDGSYLAANQPFHPTVQTRMAAR